MNALANAAYSHVLRHYNAISLHKVCAGPPTNKCDVSTFRPDISQKNYTFSPLASHNTSTYAIAIVEWLYIAILRCVSIGIVKKCSFTKRLLQLLLSGKRIRSSSDNSTQISVFRTMCLFTYSSDQNAPRIVPGLLAKISHLNVLWAT